MRETRVPAARWTEVPAGTAVQDDMLQHDSSDAPAFAMELWSAIKSSPQPNSLLSLYAFYDGEAQRLLTRHRIAAGVAVITGGFALVIGIAQLGMRAITKHELWPQRSFWTEVVLIAIGAIAVVWAMSRRYHWRWLTHRYNAEQLRLVRWRLFGKPDRWGSSEASLAEPILHEIKKSIVEDESALEDLAQRERPIDFSEVGDEASRQARLAARYYCANRLAAQIRYFERKGSDAERHWFQGPILAPLFFVFSLFFVVIHLVFVALASIPRFHAAKEALELSSLASVTVAAIVPAIWASIRTWRSANEFKRNAWRARAKERVLSKYRERLLNPDLAPNETFGTIALCEGIFAQDQGEWLRLMLETEWY